MRCSWICNDNDVLLHLKAVGFDTWHHLLAFSWSAKGILGALVALPASVAASEAQLPRVFSNVFSFCCGGLNCWSFARGQQNLRISQTFSQCNAWEKQWAVNCTSNPNTTKAAFAASPSKVEAVVEHTSCRCDIYLTPTVHEALIHAGSWLHCQLFYLVGRLRRLGNGLQLDQLSFQVSGIGGPPGKKLNGAGAQWKTKGWCFGVSSWDEGRHSFFQMIRGWWTLQLCCLSEVCGTLWKVNVWRAEWEVGRGHHLCEHGSCGPGDAWGRTFSSRR